MTSIATAAESSRCTGSTTVRSDSGRKRYRNSSLAGIPFVRTHDSGGPYGRGTLIDIPNIFRDFDADPDDPASYDFAFTDIYLRNLVNSGL